MGSCPEGIEIGSVRSVSYNSNRLIREVTADPAVDFFRSLRESSGDRKEILESRSDFPDSFLIQPSF